MSHCCTSPYFPYAHTHQNSHSLYATRIICGLPSGTIPPLKAVQPARISFFYRFACLRKQSHSYLSADSNSSLTSLSVKTFLSPTLLSINDCQLMFTFLFARARQVFLSRSQRQTRSQSWCPSSLPLYSCEPAQENLPAQGT